MSSKNPDLRVEYRVKSEQPTWHGEGGVFFAADTEAECEEWIESHCPADLMGDVTYAIQKVFTTSRKQKR